MSGRRRVEKICKGAGHQLHGEDWKECQETVAGIDRNETMDYCKVAPGVFEMCHYLCEIQNTMINFYEEPEAMHELDRIYYRVGTEMGRAGLHLYETGCCLPS